MFLTTIRLEKERVFDVVRGDDIKRFCLVLPAQLVCTTEQTGSGCRSVLGSWHGASGSLSCFACSQYVVPVYSWLADRLPYRATSLWKIVHICGQISSIYGALNAGLFLGVLIKSLKRSCAVTTTSKSAPHNPGRSSRTLFLSHKETPLTDSF